MDLTAKRRFLIAVALLVTCAGLLWFACSNSKSTNPAGLDDPNLLASKVTGSDCKLPITITSSAQSADQDCFQFSYNTDGVLLVHRVNAGFNCCPDSFGVEVDYNDRVITISECEYLTTPCHCLCLYDIDYTISGLSKRRYTIRVVEPYVVAYNMEPSLEFEVDFRKTPSGEFCVSRLQYPWGMEYAPYTSDD